MNKTINLSGLALVLLACGQFTPAAIVATPPPPPPTVTVRSMVVRLPEATPTSLSPTATSTRVVADTPVSADVLSSSQEAANTEPAAPPPAPPAEAAPVTNAGSVAIVALNKKAEYVDLRNTGAAAVDLTGWRLLSEKGPQDCALGGVIQPGKTLRVWAAASHSAGPGSFSCGYVENIWNNFEPDAAILFDTTGAAVSRME